ncbi:hypothetical protein BJI67_06980 [Acidihalobacter aeolianus]|uniref:Uncharacterized protein n=1 Tax=Acidihalobacter aeolianus TaxID=2792603 RepID=A0A1D8K788_9GAMM|nr:hypothetical protein BJI67_06980 [Acidihalobacter aeolianus]
MAARLMYDEQMDRLGVERIAFALARAIFFSFVVKFLAIDGPSKMLQLVYLHRSFRNMEFEVIQQI